LTSHLEIDLIRIDKKALVFFQLSLEK